MKILKSAILLVTICSLSACYPAYKTRQPEINLQITDTQQLPVAGAKVVLNTRAHASGVNEFVVKNSNEKGEVLFNSDKQVELEVFALHGSLQYFWNICIEKKDYVTEIIRIDEPEQAAKLNKVVLKTGESNACEHKSQAPKD